MFSLFHQILLRPLSVAAPDRLVNLGAPGPKPGAISCGDAGDCSYVFSYPMFKDLERVQQVFTGVAAHRSFGANLVYKGQTVDGVGMAVSGSYFPVLGLNAALGRLLGPEDDRSVGNHFVVVLSHDYWKARFAADPSVLNETLIVNGQKMTIVGVAPAGFEGTTIELRPKVFVPITMRGLMVPGFDDWKNRRSYWAYLFARLNPSVSLEQAATAINVPYRQILNSVEAPLQQGLSDQAMARFRARQLRVEEGSRGQSGMHKEARTPLLMLLGVTGFVLLIACANIANLLLARAASRAPEMAVRLSIGANWRHLIAQLLTESVLLASFGGIGGLLVAGWTLSLIVSMLPAEAANTISVAIDVPVIIFAAALSLGAGVFFGLFPAPRQSRSRSPDEHDVGRLRGAGDAAGGDRPLRRPRLHHCATHA